jgi:peptide/nickel transport system substrate-binding protein
VIEEIESIPERLLPRESVSSLKGDYDIRITLKYPDPEFLPYLTFGIVKANSTDRDKKAIGTGPYYIESYTVQQSLVLRKFTHYWQNGVPHLDKITIVFFADSDALTLGLHGGNIDGAGLASGALIQQLKSRNFDIVPGYSAMVQLLALNNAVPPLNDIRVRQAINYGIDIQDIINTAFFGEGKPSGSPLIPGLAVYYEQSLADPYPLNHEKALSLLSEAGYSGEQKFSLEITVPSNYVMHVDTAQVIAGQLAKIGIDVSIQLVDWPTWLSDVYRERKYQATIISLDSPNVSAKSFLSRYRSDSNSNFINYADTNFDRVYDAILTELNEDRRIDLYKKAQQLISDGAASVYIQDIMGFKAFRAEAYDGVLNYPLSVIDFSAMYGK